MQTFLPYADFTKSAQALDRQRLGKQRVECKQIFNAMYVGGKWEKHPAVRMWRGYGLSLYSYYLEIVTEWVRRGYKHNMYLSAAVLQRASTEVTKPPWLGCYQIHASHRNNLVAKNPEHYGSLFRDCLTYPNYVYYVWPVDKSGTCNFLNGETVLPF